MNLVKILLLSLCISGITQLNAQVHQFINLTEFFPAPDKTLPKPKDLSASMQGFVTPDSIIFELQVRDNKVVSGNNIENSDHIEVWFGFHESDFSDFIVADLYQKKASRIFRNSTEPGDNADVERFLKLGDYPVNGKIKNYETQEWISADVPKPDQLRKETIFYGISSFACFPDNRAPVQTNRDKYKYIEDQLFPVDDLSKNLKSKAEKTADGYKIRISLHNSCLLFGVPAMMKSFKFAVQVHDVDGKASQFISSAKNNYYARPFYFSKASFPFPLNIHLDEVPDKIINRMGIEFSCIRSGGKWRPYFYSNGPIIYAPDYMSDAGLVEYEFYPAQAAYTKSPANADVSWERLDIEYDDVSAFDQREVYFLIGDSVILSSKKYRFLNDVPGDFINSIFKLKDGSAAAVLYDYEPVDPFGWGELGMTADEFVYIQKLNKKGGQAVFNVGQRIEASGKVTIGDPKIMVLENVKSLRYRWVKFGETFEMLVDSDKPESRKTLLFQIGHDGKTELKQ